jgi:hypothetical protein
MGSVFVVARLQAGRLLGTREVRRKAAPTKRSKQESAGKNGSNTNTMREK